ncbi:MAG: DNA-protecting protein DprA, partial [Candidatus Pacebacteria bacterium]|nr:DNA-protecting protein DprA [Candidatus Paceibacterota bacterium]
TWSFPKRNRIMAGLADAVLIVEAQEKSGTLITARMALDYNKDLLAVPGSIFNTSSFGTNRLLTQGATPIVTSDDILTALHIKKKEQDETTLEGSLKDCSEEEVLIMNSLTEPLPRNELIRISNLPSEQVNSLLSLLEIKGLVKESGGIIYRKI